MFRMWERGFGMHLRLGKIFRQKTRFGGFFVLYVSGGFVGRFFVVR